MFVYLQKKKIQLILWLFILIGIVLRFYDLNWGAPYYFHPDERNIASAITQLQFPNQMNPHFFAYGSLPIYLVYFGDVVFNNLEHCMLTNQLSSALCPSPFATAVTFEQALIGLRILSATLSVLLIPLLYFIGRKLKNQTTGLFSAFFTTVSVGFIQFAHFGTYEIWLTFWSAAMFGTCLWYDKTEKKISLLFIALTTGILCASKVTSFVLLVIPMFLILRTAILHVKKLESKKEKFMRLLFLFFQLMLFVIVITDIYMMTNPYTFLDKTSFLNSMHYESGVALGTEPVFYTGEFYNTTAIVFQFLHVYPFLLTPLLTIIFIPAFLYVLYRGVKYKDTFRLTRLHRDWSFNTSYILLITFFLLLFLSQAFFFVKWTRYMVPTLPFMYLMIAVFFDAFLNWTKGKSKQMFKHTKQLYTVAFCYIVIVSFSFIVTVYVETDTRIAAAAFAAKNTPSNASIMSEVYDLGITAFNADFSNIKLFNFYDLDNQSPESSPSALALQLKTTNYIVLPSQRILKVRLENAKKFPNGNAFYTQLFNGKLGFQEIYETPCDIWCTITYAGNPVFSYEETTNVFDRPTLFIFKKNK